MLERLLPRYIEMLIYEAVLQNAASFQSAQMVAMKANAADAGLDWATPEFDDVEFIHMDTMLGRFCEDLAKLLGIARQHLREHLAAKVA